MNITISVSGLDAINAQLANLLDEKLQQTDEAVQEAGINTEAGAKQLAPVDTGRFRSGYQYQNTGLYQCQVSNPVEYGPDLEWGTSKMAARPSLFPAAATAETQLQSDLKAIWKS